MNAAPHPQARVTDPFNLAWSRLRAFFSEGTTALEAAVASFETAGAPLRAAGDPSDLSLWLLGFATALRYTRRPEAMDLALDRARELVNVTVRQQGEAASIPYRTLVEITYRDLADVVSSDREAYLNAGLTYSDRTVRLARSARRDEWSAAAWASRGDLVVRRGLPSAVRAARRAVTLHEDARRLWPARDASGRAQAALGYAEALLAAREAGKAESVVRSALPIFAADADRYHQAGAHLLLARALFALDQSEALDEQAAAVALYKMLGCRWELSRAERAFS
jgi:hypothetical protein